jgi:hypothetical protein
VPGWKNASHSKKGDNAMSSGNVSVGQWADFSSKVTARLWPALKSGAKSGALDINQFAKDPDLVQKALVAGFSFVQESLAHKRLIKVVTVELEAIDEFDPETWSTQEGIWFSEEVRTKLLLHAKKVTNRAAVNMTGYNLKVSINDFEIEKELGERVVFGDVSVFFLRLAQLIAKQKNGEEGALLNDGRYTLFQVRCASEVFAVHVAWYAGCREWGVNAYALGDDEWDAGGCVFSCNC